MGGTISALVFQPPNVSYNIVAVPLVWLQTESGNQIPAFYIDRKAKVTLLFSHGNAEDLGLIYEWFVSLSAELKVNVLAYEFDGYGRSSAALPSEQACYEDISAAYHFLTKELRQLPENIVLYGRSLGSGPTLFLAEKLAREKVRLGGVILQSPITSIFRILFPFRWTLPGDHFCNIDKIGNVNAPLLVIHGIKDEIVPFAHGEELFLASQVEMRAKPLWVDGAGHNNLESFL